MIQQPECLDLSARTVIKEKRDCSVRALARALDVSWQTAHAICKKHGRKNKKGFSLIGTVFNMRRNEFKMFEFYGKKFLVTMYGRPKMTMATFVASFPEGRFIVCVPRHYCNVIDGNVYDQDNTRQRVKYYFKIKEIKS